MTPQAITFTDEEAEQVIHALSNRVEEISAKVQREPTEYWYDVLDITMSAQKKVSGSLGSS